MKRMLFSITVCLALGAAATAAFAGDPPPTAAEVQQKAMKEGPSTPRIGYLTHREANAPRREAAPADPHLLKPLSQREIGMLYSACIAYPECASAYSKAYEHNQALLKAQKAGGPEQ